MRCALVSFAASSFPAGAAQVAAQAGTSIPKAAAPGVESSRQARRDVAVTAYNNNLALIREVRDIGPLPRGEFDLRFLDVPSQINPRTVALRSLTPGAGLTVLEQNYEYDLTSPARLMEKSVGREVDLVETDQNLTDRTTRAKLLSTNDGYVYDAAGRILLGHPGRVVLPGLPEGLFTRPTLVWKLANPGPATQQVEAAYLTGGISWSADYIAVADPETTKADLTAWVTLDNRSGASYGNALLKLVAGDVQQVAPEYDVMKTMSEVRVRAPSFSEQSFFEYHLYTLDRRTDIRENQTKQVRLFHAGDVPVRKRLLITGNSGQFRGRLGTIMESQPVGVFIEIKNGKEAGLGIPLPAGIVRVYQQDRDGAQQ
ncbi:MAG: DUF4139 domain-containing protein, partial [Thermoplasmata archaeon]